MGADDARAMKSVDAVVTLRPRRYIALVIASAVAGFGGLVLSGAVETKRIDQFVWAAAFLLAALMIGVNFYRFCYARITSYGIERVNLFGLLRGGIPIDDVISVEVTTHTNLVLMSIPSLVVNHARGSIQFSAAKYHEQSLAAAAGLLERIRTSGGDAH